MTPGTSAHVDSLSVNPVPANTDQVGQHQLQALTAQALDFDVCADTTAADEPTCPSAFPWPLRDSVQLPPDPLHPPPVAESGKRPHESFQQANSCRRGLWI